MVNKEVYYIITPLYFLPVTVKRPQQSWVNPNNPRAGVLVSDDSDNE